MATVAHRNPTTHNSDTRLTTQYPTERPHTPMDYPAPAPSPPTYPEPRRTSGLAVTALVLGIVSLLGPWLVPVFGIIVAIVALIFAGTGLMATRHRAGRGMAIAGLVTGIIALILAFVFTLAVGKAVNSITNSTTNPAAPAATTAPAAAPQASGPATTVGDGTFVVGTDIAAGTWKTTGGGDGDCAWVRLKDTTGDPSAIIADGQATGPTTVTIKTTDKAYQTIGGCTWTKIG